MANRFPLVVDSTNNNIKELPSGDNLDMTGSGFANLTTIAANAYNETYVTASASGSPPTVTIDCSAGTHFLRTLATGTNTFVFSNAPASKAYGFVLKLTQDSTDRAVTWPGTVDWAAGTAPTISSGNGKVDIFVFNTFDAGTIWYGFTAGQAMA